MPKRRAIETAAAQGLIAKLLQGNKFDSEFEHAMLDVFMNVCRALNVTDPADPLSTTIAQTVILIASEGEHDPDQLFRETLSRFKENG